MHITVIHEREFVTEGGYNTHSIESILAQVKMWMSPMHGVEEKHFDRYLCDYMYRYNYYAKGGRVLLQSTAFRY